MNLMFLSFWLLSVEDSLDFTVYQNSCFDIGTHVCMYEVFISSFKNVIATFEQYSSVLIVNLCSRLQGHKNANIAEHIFSQTCHLVQILRISVIAILCHPSVILERLKNTVKMYGEYGSFEWFCLFVCSFAWTICTK